MHQICHFEIPSTDLKKSSVFYKKVFNWKLQDFSEAYILVMIDKNNSGGIYLAEEIKPSQINIYFEVESIPETLMFVSSNGGEIVEPKRSIGENGYIGTFKDPCGVNIDIWSKN